MRALAPFDRLRKVLADSRPQRSSRCRGALFTELPSLEPLEARRLLSGSPFIYTATSSDSLRLKIVTSKLNVIDDVTHAVLKSAALSSINQVQINGFHGGNQALTVDTSGGQFPIPIAFNPSGSGNSLRVDDSTDTASVNYTVSNVEVSVGATAIAYNSALTAGLVLLTGTGADYVNVLSTQGQTPTTIDSSGVAATKFSIGGGFTASGGMGTGSLANIAGPLTLGSHAADSLTALDNGNSAPDFYSVMSTGLSWNNLNSLTYASAQSITLATDSFGGSIFVRSLPASTTYVGLAPGGTRTSMIISPDALNAPQQRLIDASSMVPAGAADLLAVDDSTDTRQGVNYNIFNFGVTVGIPVPVNPVATLVDYSAGVSGGLGINTGLGAGDAVSVFSTLATVAVAVNTSGVNPTSIAVGAGAGNSLASVAGPLTLQTFAIDQISFNDQGDASAATYYLTTNYLVWNHSIIGYRSVASISVTTGSHAADTLFVSSLPASTTNVTLAPGGVSASFIVSSGPLQVAGRVIDAATNVPAHSNAFVTVDDSIDPNPLVGYKITSSSVTLSTGTTVLYGANDSGGLVINTGKGVDDTANVYSTLAQVQVAINTSGFNPTTIQVGGDLLAPIGNLAAIAGPLTLKDAPIDAIDFLDQTSTAPASYTLTASGLFFNNQIIGYTSATVIDLFTSTARDTINVPSLPAALLEVNFHVENSAAQPGTSITLGAGAMTTSSLQRTFQLGSSTPSGSGGVPAGADDVLTVDDSADSTPGVDYTVGPGQIGVLIGATGHNVIAYSTNFAAIALLTGSGAGDVVNITGTSVPTDIITSAAGSAAITVGNSGNLDGISAGLNIVSKSKNDRLTLDDSANSAFESYVVTATSLQRGGLTIAYQGFASFTVLTGTFEQMLPGGPVFDQVTVKDLPAGDTLNLTIQGTNEYFVDPTSVFGKINLTVR